MKLIKVSVGREGNGVQIILSAIFAQSLQKLLNGEKIPDIHEQLLPNLIFLCSSFAHCNFNPLYCSVFQRYRAALN